MKLLKGVSAWPSNLDWSYFPIPECIYSAKTQGILLNSIFHGEFHGDQGVLITPCTGLAMITGHSLEQI